MREGVGRLLAGARDVLWSRRSWLGRAFLILHLLGAAAVGGAIAWRVAAEAATERAAASLEHELKTLRGEIARRQGEQGEVRARLQSIESARDRARARLVQDALRSMASRVVAVTAFNTYDDKLQITAVAASASAVADFLAELRRAQACVDLDIVPARSDTAPATRRLTFDITCSLTP